MIPLFSPLFHRLRHWMKSLHAKLFVILALVTAFITVALAFSIIRDYRRQIDEYAKQLAVDAAQTVSKEIQERDPHFNDPRTIKEMLETWAGSERSVFQIDVFQAIDRDTVILKASSRPDDDPPDYGSGIASFMTTTGGKPSSSLVDLTTGSKAWKVYLPIENPNRNQPPLGLVRTYCDLERWEVVWQKSLQQTWRLLPFVLLLEFVLLWFILGLVVRKPLNTIVEAMGKLERGDTSARAHIHRGDELGHIAGRFNGMASELQRAGQERDALMEQIRTFNTSLQDRIDMALMELQKKNGALEQLVERNALLREELSQQERLAVAGQLTAAFAHEVGTPLNLVNSHLQLLKGQSGLDDKTRDRLGLIQAQIERVGGIVRKLLDHTRRPQLQQESIELQILLDELQRLWAPSLANHGVSFKMEIPSACTLRVDRKQMEQIFINLVNNAVDAMPSGGQIELSVDREGDFWKLALQDSGVGIPEEHLSQVFKPMFTTKPEGKGTGLGLAIVREIVRTHGGEVRIESQVGKGTRIIFTLPDAK